MNALGPGYLVPYIMIGSIAVVLVALFGLHRALSRANLPSRDRSRAFWIGSALLIGWFLAALALSWSGFYRQSRTGLPAVPLGLLVPIAAGVLLFRTWPLFRRIVDALPQRWIVSIQAYRIEGMIFLLLYANGRLPGEFALPAGLGDMAVGLLAPLAAAGGSSARLRAWNLSGITDLVVAVTTGFLTSPSPVQLLALDRPNELISAFPLVLIPVFLVPFSVLLHLASLQKLRRNEV
jgi:hypothetical protein